MTLHHLETAIKVLYISGVDGQNLRSECKKHCQKKLSNPSMKNFALHNFPPCSNIKGFFSIVSCHQHLQVHSHEKQ